jgi:hypothetical protein
MPVDRRPPAPRDHRRPAPEWQLAERPPERAQVVWLRALELSGQSAHQDGLESALDLLRSAHHDPATMVHALSLARTYLRDHPDDAVAAGGALLLHSAITFLGVRPHSGDVAGAATAPAVTASAAPGPRRGLTRGRATVESGGRAC